MNPVGRMTLRPEHPRAMTAGVTKQLREIADLVKVLEDWADQRQNVA